jgi:hypothetical protein
MLRNRVSLCSRSRFRGVPIRTTGVTAILSVPRGDVGNALLACPLRLGLAVVSIRWLAALERTTIRAVSLARAWAPHLDQDQALARCSRTSWPVDRVASAGLRRPVSRSSAMRGLSPSDARRRVVSPPSGERCQSASWSRVRRPGDRIQADHRHLSYYGDRTRIRFQGRHPAPDATAGRGSGAQPRSRARRVGGRHAGRSW